MVVSPGPQSFARHEARTAGGATVREWSFPPSERPAASLAAACIDHVGELSGIPSRYSAAGTAANRLIPGVRFVPASFGAGSRSDGSSGTASMEAQLGSIRPPVQRERLLSSPVLVPSSEASANDSVEAAGALAGGVLPWRPQGRNSAIVQGGVHATAGSPSATRPLSRTPSQSLISVPRSGRFPAASAAGMAGSSVQRSSGSAGQSSPGGSAERDRRSSGDSRKAVQQQLVRCSGIVTLVLCRMMHACSLVRASTRTSVAAACALSAAVPRLSSLCVAL